jgi:hypothetical protein
LKPNEILDPADGLSIVRNVATLPDSSFSQVCGTLEVLDPDNSGVQQINWYGFSPRENRVLDTDYESWAAVYSCSEDPEFPLEFAWV